MDPCVRGCLRASVRYNCQTVFRINGVAKEGQIGGHIAAQCYKLQNQKQTYFYQKTSKIKSSTQGTELAPKQGGPRGSAEVVISEHCVWEFISIYTRKRGSHAASRHHAGSR